MVHIYMSDHNSKLLSRGLQSRMDHREERSEMVEACLGYAGSVSIMAMDAVVDMNDRVIGEVQALEEGIRRVDGH